MEFIKIHLWKISSICCILVLLLAFQNCGNSKSFAAKSPANQSGTNGGNGNLVGGTTDGSANGGLSCGDYALGAKWYEETGGVIPQTQSCPNGGNLTYYYKEVEQFECVNGEPQQVGSTSKGNFSRSVGACNPDNCSGRPEGSTWSSVSGEISKNKSCTDSAVVIQQVYQNMKTYKCVVGNPVYQTSAQGSYIGDVGTCPVPYVSASFSSSQAALGNTVNLVVNALNVSTVSYTCNTVSGNLGVGSSTTAITVSEDISCTVKAMTSTGQSYTAVAQVGVDCDQADQVYSGGKCQVFACNSFVELTTFPVKVPARTSAGICYYSKLFDAVANRPSGGSQNNNILSRTHGVKVNGAVNQAPFILGPGPASRQFTLLGSRAVKVSGNKSVLAPIRVDNYMLVGQRLSTEPETTNGWKAYGTADSTILNQNYVQAYGKNVVLETFGPAGTATVNALLLTQEFEPKFDYILDIHALDCGGSAELSELYLMFQ